MGISFPKIIYGFSLVKITIPNIYQKCQDSLDVKIEICLF